MINVDTDIKSLYINKQKEWLQQAKFRVGKQSAEDAVQQGFTTAWASRYSYNPISEDLVKYCSRHLSRAIKAIQREKRLEGMTTVSYETYEAEYTPNLGNTVVDEAYLKLFAKQDVPMQNILHLHFDRGYSYQEIAEIVEGDYDNIKYLLRKFKLSVRKMLEDDVF